ncbi:proteobacterial dedicated sortase system response regulator [Marinicella meishanensis]|uniref:proteobacterial dedicated sortase system response regulator n=1 Tax=Marinicella meishanensis TaxID=2873263 RepID=UPI001CC09B77|nr:proteobacterial dedicated sortase system response regulator [Marinicella sp. NBU2979]
MKAKRIVIVEDETDLRANYQATLEKHGYQTTGLGDASAAERHFAQSLPDLVILDVGLGHEPDAGFRLCQWLRQQSATLPILMLTARDDEIDVVSGLRLGADDYLSKDISMPHLLARIASLFRRQEASQAGVDEAAIEQGDLLIKIDNLQIFWQQQLLDLTVTEFWMVQSLARYPGQVKTREQLMQDANVYVDDSTITSHIKRIRKKFQKIDPAFDQIDTVHGMGYRWKP